MQLQSGNKRLGTYFYVYFGFGCSRFGLRYVLTFQTSTKEYGSALVFGILKKAALALKCLDFGFFNFCSRSR